MKLCILGMLSVRPICNTLQCYVIYYCDSQSLTIIAAVTKCKTVNNVAYIKLLCAHYKT